MSPTALVPIAAKTAALPAAVSAAAPHAADKTAALTTAAVSAAAPHAAAKTAALPAAVSAAAPPAAAETAALVSAAPPSKPPPSPPPSPPDSDGEESADGEPEGKALAANAVATFIPMSRADRQARELECLERKRAAHAERQRQQPPEMLIDFESLRKLERKAESMGYSAAAYWDERVEEAKEICPEWLAELRREFDGETRLTAEGSALGSQAPSLRNYRNKAMRTPDSLPARFYRMMMGEEWDGEAHSYSIATKRHRRWEEPYQQRERERQQRKKRDYSKKKRPADDNARRQARRKAQREREKAARARVVSSARLASAHGQEGNGGGTLTEGGLPLHASAHGQDVGGDGTLTEGGLPLLPSAPQQPSAPPRSPPPSPTVREAAPVAL